MKDNLETILELHKRQLDVDKHPLTCGYEGKKHSKLVPALDIDGKVILVCKNCSYVQYTLPELPKTVEAPQESIH